MTPRTGGRQAPFLFEPGAISADGDHADARG